MRFMEAGVKTYSFMQFQTTYTFYYAGGSALPVEELT
jgi:hypothetical protein